MKRTAVRERREIEVQGIVQGVGFRPFVYELARRHHLSGSVRNDSSGVHVVVEGTPGRLESFLSGIRNEAPPLAVIEAIECRPLAARGERGFHIEASQAADTHRALISPDVATCGDCLSELLDRENRRYRYPFINCTNCGPRFTITKSVPYDRASTTMAGFAMCAACRTEYENPLDRRFHAQPNACPICGPRATLCDGRMPLASVGSDPIAQAAQLLHGGSILAIKGLGGYHLACDPFNNVAVHTLRSRKARQDKPLALMVRNLDQALWLCGEISDAEAELLSSHERPIVLLQRRANDGLAEDVAPRQKTIGVMLEYTPLHHLLLGDFGGPLVMTSGNMSDEPIAYRDVDAIRQLSAIADYYLVHDRPIHIRCDDTVTRVTRGRASVIRRSRGYAPAPLSVAHGFSRPVLACGAHLKNTFCVAKDRHAFVSHHIGDLDNYTTLESFREAVDHYCDLFDIRPQLIACDLHPDYHSSLYAREIEASRDQPLIEVQHHHAHIASCLADNDRPADEVVIGVAMDGTGYGADGTIWGGEVFVGSIAGGFDRRAHLATMPMPGGEAAVRNPWRMALGCLLTQFTEREIEHVAPQLIDMCGREAARTIASMVSGRVNSPVTSSAGRLFDVVSALCRLPGTDAVTYEGQAAIELELAADAVSDFGYPMQMLANGDQIEIETREMICAVLGDLRRGVGVAKISSRFHRGLAEMIVRVCERLRDEHGLRAVALSGGTFQNALLFDRSVALLEQARFTVYRHVRVPTNDGGISLGQAVLADWVVRSGRDAICA